MEEVESSTGDSTKNPDEESKDTNVSPERSVESWSDDPPVAAREPAESLQANDYAPANILTLVETAAPSVTPSRKNELLLQARADRLAWIQSVPLPYISTNSSTAHDAGLDPWNSDDRLVFLRDSNAIQSLPSMPQVLSSLYGIENGISSDVVAERIQAQFESLHMTQEDRQLATESLRKESLVRELSSAQTQDQQKRLKAYQALITRLQTPECATLVQGMRTFVRNLSGTDEVMASSLRSYLKSTFEAIKSHKAFSGLDMDDAMLHALESFLYGHCHDKIHALYKQEEEDDKEFLDRVKSLQFVTAAHLEVASLVNANVDELLKEPIETLLSVDRFHSPYEKLHRILKVYHGVNDALSKALNKDGGDKLPSADDVLPSLILTTLRSKSPHLIVNLRKIEVLCPPEYLRGEAGYAYTNLYGAIQFLRDLDMDKPDALHIDHDEFQEKLEECRVSADTRWAQLTESAEQEEDGGNDTALFLPVEIPVGEVRAAGLRGETIDLEWARHWQLNHGTKSQMSLPEVSPSLDRGDGLPSSLPPGFSRTYSFMVTRPEDVRVSELPQLLAEYRMLVHVTEQLLGERTTRLASERKQKLATARAAFLARAAEVDLSRKTRNATTTEQR